MLAEHPGKGKKKKGEGHEAEGESKPEGGPKHSVGTSYVFFTSLMPYDLSPLSLTH